MIGGRRPKLTNLFTVHAADSVAPVAQRDRSTATQRPQLLHLGIICPGRVACHFLLVPVASSCYSDGKFVFVGRFLIHKSEYVFLTYLFVRYSYFLVYLVAAGGVSHTHLVSRPLHSCNRHFRLDQVLTLTTVRMMCDPLLQELREKR